MRAKIRQILEECIISGIEYGYERAHKHTDDPSESHIQGCIEDAIWLEIDERFEFDRDLVSEVVEGFDHLEKARSAEIDVEQIEEHEDGSATYRFHLTPEYADALLQNGIMWAIVSGATGVTIEQVLQDHAMNDDHLNLAFELGQEAAKRDGVCLTQAEMNELIQALEDAAYLLNPTEEDMQKKTGLYRITTALEMLKEKKT